MWDGTLTHNDVLTCTLISYTLVAIVYIRRIVAIIHKAKHVRSRKLKITCKLFAQPI